jgi:transposase
MAQNFISCDRDQELLLPPSLREWLPDDHLAWFVLEAVEELNLEAFYAAYRDDGWGRAAHEPGMMVALLVYAYSVGVRSARGIERRCREDVAFRVITANQVPDHATIARFRARHEAAIGDLFGGVLELCAKAGLVKVGIVAVDGTKIAAAATHHATRSYEQIAKEIVEEAGRIDAEEDELYGDARGDELPAGLRTSGDRRRVLREAKQALDAERAAAAKKIPRDRGERLADCKRRLEQDWALERKVITEHAAWHARGIASDGSRRMAGARANIKPYPLTDRPAGKLNVTDPDSRNLKTTRGWVQGYNAQAAVTEQQIVVAAEISVESLDTANLQPDPHRARSRRHRREARGGAGRRRLLEKRGDRSARRQGHPDPGRPRRRPAQRTEARPPRRPLRLHPKSAGDRLRQGALPQAPGHGRAGLWTDQVKPRRQPLLTPRPGGRPLGMAAPHRDPQPPQAPPAPTRRHLSPGAATEPSMPAETRRRPTASPPAKSPPATSFTRHPPR